MRLVLFDIDGTLIAGRSTERRFYAYLLRHRAQGPRQFLSYAGGLASGVVRHGRHVLKKNKAYLAGVRVERVQRLARDWARTELQNAWYPPAVACLQHHLDKGDEVVLLSGTPDFLAVAIAEELEVSDSIGSIVPSRNGRFLGAPVSQHPFGREKRELARRLANSLNRQPKQIVAYADSHYDLPLLEWVGTVIAVRPDRRLRALALRKGWPVLDGVEPHFIGAADGSRRLHQ